MCGFAKKYHRSSGTRPERSYVDLSADTASGAGKLAKPDTVELCAATHLKLQPFGHATVNGYEEFYNV